MKKNIKAFTLAEVMIVFAVIGVLTAVLLPAAFHTNPNKDILKFKKANSTFATIIRELINSNKYYYSYDLGLMQDSAPTGNGYRFVDSPTYLCETMADVLETKKVKCNNSTVAYGGASYDATAVINLKNMAATKMGENADKEDVDAVLDYLCKNNIPPEPDIITADGVSIYILNPDYHFGSMIQGTPGGSDLNRIFYILATQKRLKTICIDIDKIGKDEGEDPFGYGLRADGKIVLGQRAKKWLESEIHDDEPGAVTGITSCQTCSSVNPDIINY